MSPRRHPASWPGPETRHAGQPPLPLAVALPVAAQAATPLPLPAATPTPDPWQAVAFLEGTWKAGTGVDSAARVTGAYTFAKELQGHVLARHGMVAGCSGPAAYDCQHADLLHVFQDAPGQALKAIYLDNEGHVLHYTVSTPAPATVVFLAEPGPGPRFRLVYRLEAGVMSGKFQIGAPGRDDWMSYLEWSGGRQP